MYHIQKKKIIIKKRENKYNQKNHETKTKKLKIYIFVSHIDIINTRAVLENTRKAESKKYKNLSVT